MNRWDGTRRGDAGLSLAETLVAMAIASVIMLAIGTLFVSSLRQNRTVLAKTTSTADARIAMEALTRNLRVASKAGGSASAIISGTNTSVSFYSSIGTTTATTDPRPSLITYSVDTARKCLWREITPATVVGTTWTWPVANKKATCVARGNFNVAGTPLFTYFPLNPADDTIATTPFAIAAVPANLANIAAVGINLMVTDAANTSVPPTTLQDQVTLINVTTGLQAG